MKDISEEDGYGFGFQVGFKRLKYSQKLIRMKPTLVTVYVKNPIFLFLCKIKRVFTF